VQSWGREIDPLPPPHLGGDLTVKDKYGNNLRRGDEVTNADNDKGTVSATVTNLRGYVLVRWENGREDQVRADYLRREKR